MNDDGSVGAVLSQTPNWGNPCFGGIELAAGLDGGSGAGIEVCSAVEIGSRDEDREETRRPMWSEERKRSGKGKKELEI